MSGVNKVVADMEKSYAGMTALVDKKFVGLVWSQNLYGSNA